MIQLRRFCNNNTSRGGDGDGQTWNQDIITSKRTMQLPPLSESTYRAAYERMKRSPCPHLSPELLVSTYRNPEEQGGHQAGMEPHSRGMELGVGVAGTRLSPGIIIRIQEHQSAEWYLRLYSWRCCSSRKKEMHENYMQQ